MPKLIVSIDGVVVKEFQLTKGRTTLGRRPYNDVVIDNLAVSGEHAAVELKGATAEIEDLNSTNGTFLHGKAVRREELKNGDIFEIGKCTVQFLADGAGQQPPQSSLSLDAGAAAAVLKIISGAGAGRELPLVKEVTTVGKPGVLVATIARQPSGYFLTYTDGQQAPMVNGVAIGHDPVGLHDGDKLLMAGTEMTFSQI